LAGISKVRGKEPMGPVWGKLDPQAKEKEESFQKSSFGGF
jgi:hypothetical protein